MIALSGCIGKTYHLLLAGRLKKYLTVNKFVDASLQKAFLPGINGCIEHNIVMDEIIKDAKQRKKTCYVTFLDLEDAFGCVPHSLIDLTLERNFIPQVIQKNSTIFTLILLLLFKQVNGSQKHLSLNVVFFKGTL